MSFAAGLIGCARFAPEHSKKKRNARAAFPLLPFQGLENIWIRKREFLCCLF